MPVAATLRHDTGEETVPEIDKSGSFCSVFL
jgi:hypothetical protein